MFGPEVEAAAQSHARSEHPKESCGIVVGGVYIPIENVAPTKMVDGVAIASFGMPEDTWIAHGTVQAVIHSHGAGYKREPSADDMQHQISTAVPWGIVWTNGENASPILWWGDHLLDEPITGRSYVWGVNDCWSIIRAWYWQRRGIKLLDFPRDADQFMKGVDLFSDKFAAAGFHPIPADELQVGDMVFMNIRGAVPNHCGLIVEGSLLLHHLPNRLSARTPFGNWRSLVTKWLRHEG